MKPHYLFLFLLALFLAAIAGCAPHHAEEQHREVNSIYYWKTVFDIYIDEHDFMERHDVNRMYIRMFDVVPQEYGDEIVVPNATFRIEDEWGHTFWAFRDNTVDVVPVVYITLEALKAMKDNEGILASNIVERVKNMCSYHELPNVEELQLDCDWTVSTEDSFFALCDSVKSALNRNVLPWKLSSTIRLHQLARRVPPVDRGVLMVYNTGNFNDPDARNSIIDADDVEPYLKHLPSYGLHLDVAYPTYSWQILYRDRKLLGLLRDADVSDASLFAKTGPNTYRVRRDTTIRGTKLLECDMVRHEESEFAEVLKVKQMIESKLSGRRHSNILYHFDSKNLSKYSQDEIEQLYSTGR